VIVLSIDPGEHTGIAVLEDEVNGRIAIVRHEAIRISSRKGAIRLRDVFDEIHAAYPELKDMVIENQYPRPGRSYSSIFGLAANRGKVELLAAIHGLTIHRVKPDDWKRPVLAALGCSWRASPMRKIVALRRHFESTYPHWLSEPPSSDVIDSICMGRWWMNPTLYL